VKPPKYERVAAIIRGQIAGGQLPPGAAAPSGAALARATGYSVLTCRRAVRALIEDGTLAPGVSRRARPRVPGPGRPDRSLADAERELSAALAGRRRAAGLTQPQLAEIAGVSVTRVGHAETGRLWQSRRFWELTDNALSARGELLRLHDAYLAAQVSPACETAAEDTAPAELKARVARLEAWAETATRILAGMQAGAILTELAKHVASHEPE
jgi:DNA-binding transcriptional MocR family regulator